MTTEQARFEMGAEYDEVREAYCRFRGQDVD
jgi:hypothetical protein